MTPDRGRLRRLVARFSRVRVAVAGDLIADEFIYGHIERVSREAPVFIVGYDSSQIVPGGAGNAAANVAALGGRAEVVGVAGRDSAGQALVGALRKTARVGGVMRPPTYVTPVKTRILAGGSHSARQQIVRVDRRASAVTDAMKRHVARRLARVMPDVDVVILSDYGSGLMTADVWQDALDRATLRKPPRVVVDSRYALASYRQVTACTPNQSEVEALLGVTIGDNRETLERAGRDLLEQLQAQAVLITRGSSGMSLFERARATAHIPIVGSDQVTDVTGAGDTVIATFALALGAGASLVEAAHLSNHAGGLVVMKRGTATVSGHELTNALAARTSS